jgi:hypothetical protein
MYKNANKFIQANSIRIFSPIESDTHMKSYEKNNIFFTQTNQTFSHIIILMQKINFNLIQ